MRAHRRPRRPAQAPRLPRTLLALLLAGAPATSMGQAPSTIDPAVRAGRIVGGAAGCGLAQSDLDRAARLAAASLRAATRDPEELKRLQARYEEAFATQAEATKGFDEAACTPVAEAFLAYLRGRG